METPYDDIEIDKVRHMILNSVDVTANFDSRDRVISRRRLARNFFSFQVLRYRRRLAYFNIFGYC